MNMKTKKALIEKIENHLALKFGRDGELSGVTGHYDHNGRWVSPETIFYDVCDAIDEFYQEEEERK